MSKAANHCLLYNWRRKEIQENMTDLHSLPKDWWPSQAVRNNGPDNLVIERAKLRELAEGWPCYRYIDEDRDVHLSTVC